MSKTALLLATAVVVLPLSACAAQPTTTPGPAEVSVVKQPRSVPTGGLTHLSRLDPDTASGGEQVVWDNTLTDLWLPEAVELTAGLGGDTAASGRVFLTVPADYRVASAAVTSHQDRSRFTDYSAVEVSEDMVPKGGTVGTAVQGTVGTTQYTVTISPAPQHRPGFSIVMVQWRRA